MDSIIWLALAVLFAIAEMTTVNLVTIWFALGALIALVFSMFGIDFVWQMWIFIVSAVAFLVLTKPLVKNKLDASTLTYEEIHSTIKEAVRNVNRTLPSYKRIKKVVIREAAFSKTSTHKIKR